MEPQKLLNSLSFSLFPLQLRFCHWAKPPLSSLFFPHHSISSISFFVVFFCIKICQFFWNSFLPSQSKNEQRNPPPTLFFKRVIILWFLLEEKELLNFSTNITFYRGGLKPHQPISRQDLTILHYVGVHCEIETSRKPNFQANLVPIKVWMRMCQLSTQCFTRIGWPFPTFNSLFG